MPAYIKEGYVYALSNNVGAAAILAASLYASVYTVNTGATIQRDLCSANVLTVLDNPYGIIIPTNNPDLQLGATISRIGITKSGTSWYVLSFDATTNEATVGIWGPTSTSTATYNVLLIG